MAQHVSDRADAFQFVTRPRWFLVGGLQNAEIGLELLNIPKPLDLVP